MTTLAVQAAMTLPRLAQVLPLPSSGPALSAALCTAFQWHGPLLCNELLHAAGGGYGSSGRGSGSGSGQGYGEPATCRCNVV